MSQLVLRFSNAAKWAGTAYKNKVWRAGHFCFFRAGRLGGVICMPEGVKTPPSLRARKNQECTMDRLYFISKMPKNVNKLNLKVPYRKNSGTLLSLLWRLSIVGHVKRTYSVPWGDASLNYCLCQRSLYPLRTMHFSKGRRQNSGPFIQI